MIKDYKIHEGDPDETEHRLNWKTYTPSAGAAGMLLHIISFVFAHDLSPCVTYDRLLVSAEWWMPLVEHDIIYQKYK
jgi:hypothetical protein